MPSDGVASPTIVLSVSVLFVFFVVEVVVVAVFDALPESIFLFTKSYIRIDLQFQWHSIFKKSCIRSPFVIDNGIAILPLSLDSALGWTSGAAGGMFNFWDA